METLKLPPDLIASSFGKFDLEDENTTIEDQVKSLLISFAVFNTYYIKTGMKSSNAKTIVFVSDSMPGLSVGPFFVTLACAFLGIKHGDEEEERRVVCYDQEAFEGVRLFGGF